MQRAGSHTRRAVHALLAGLCLALPLAAAADEHETPQPESELYMWHDGNGVVRYTTDRGRIPVSARGSAVMVRRCSRCSPSKP